MQDFAARRILDRPPRSRTPDVGSGDGLNRAPARRRTGFLCAHFFQLSLAAACAGCGTGSLDPAASGGAPLAGTQGTDYQGGAPFSISSDGRWMSFALDVALPADVADNAAALADFELDRLLHFRLLNLEGGGVIQPAVSSEAEAMVRAGGYLLPGAGCWTGGVLVLRGAANRSLLLDPDERPPVWRAGPRNAELAGCPFPNRRPLESGDYGPVRLAAGDDGRVVLSDRRSGRELAVHEPGWLPGMAIQVPYLEVSPDGRHVAYGILDHFGSFVGNTTAYSLSLTDSAGAQALGAPVYSVRWAPGDGVLYGYAGLVERGATAYAIYRWRLTK